MTHCHMCHREGDCRTTPGRGGGEKGEIRVEVEEKKGEIRVEVDEKEDTKIQYSSGER